MSRSLLSRLAARGLAPALSTGATESSELKLLPRPSLSSRLTSRFPLVATLASLRSIDPEWECPMLKFVNLMTIAVARQRGFQIYILNFSFSPVSIKELVMKTKYINRSILGVNLDSKYCTHHIYNSGQN